MKLLVSGCLLGMNCRYSGDSCYRPDIVALREEHQLIPVCPEILGGLPTPRYPAEIQGNRVINSKGEDVTVFFKKGAEEVVRLAEILKAEGAILKANSPSCGCGCIYDGSFTGTKIVGNGIASQMLLDKGIAIWNETNYKEGL